MEFQKYEVGLGTWIYNVELSREESERIFNRAVEYVRKDVSVPGYRKGNVPDNILFSQFKDKINDTFENFVFDAITGELRKEHKRPIDSYVVLHTRPSENDKYLVTMKISEPTEIFFPSSSEIESDLKSINFSEFTLSEENFTINEEIEEILKSHLDLEKEISLKENNRYVIGLEFKFSDGKEEFYEVIDLYVTPNDSEIKNLFDNKNINDNNTIKLNNFLKKVIKDDYIPNFIGISREINLEDNARIAYIYKLHKYSDELEEPLNDLQNILKSFNLILDVDNLKRLENKCISHFVKKYGFSLNEDELIDELSLNFSRTLVRMRKAPVHIFAPYLDIQLLKQHSLNKLLQREFYKGLYKHFFNSDLADKDITNDTVKKVLQRIYQSINLSTVVVSVDELFKRRIYVLANIIKNITNLT